MKAWGKIAASGLHLWRSGKVIFAGKRGCEVEPFPERFLGRFTERFTVVDGRRAVAVSCLSQVSNSVE